MPASHLQLRNPVRGKNCTNIYLLRMAFFPDNYLVQILVVVAQWRALKGRSGEVSRSKARCNCLSSWERLCFSEKTDFTAGGKK